MSDHIPMRVAVVGATGFQGGATARLLAERGHRVRTISRRPEADRPEIPGVTVAPGDLGRYDDVRALFEKATHAAVVLPLVYEAEKVMTYAQHIAKAARETGLRRVVYNANTRIPDRTTNVAAFETRRLAETVFRESLAQSEVELVVVRPPVYLDNLFSPWNGPALVDEGVLAYPLPADAPVSWMSHRDLAEAVYAALTVDGVAGRAFDIGGSRTLTGEELAAAFGEGLAREVRYVPLDPTVFEQSLAQVIGAPAACGVAGLYHYMASGVEPDLMAGDDGATAAALSVKPLPAAAWVAAQPWHMWAGGQA
ncbi:MULTISPECIES: SDR family oxidoreductase [Streptomyces]|uniref:NmrA family NAD(P)-binding protein n=1 Tax=Streptomyces chengmaiensis TaxID=3040919 RepID=A0ABT6HG97_9ACTN|nr:MULTISPECIES: NmrA family NAD(P)-binding protein [Streptomyces]MDH2387258.1 NmrA family NAD(P)-binding protein [Streptomyces chengmaiensis]WRQ81152.1 NmrA family NAD(P)-binding protein [Streptomyces sp. MUM 178J]